MSVRWMLPLVLALASCTRPVDDRVGSSCTSSAECADSATLLECVRVGLGGGNNDAICVGIPDRLPNDCQDDEDCQFADVGRFPVEARCVDGACGCFADEPDCFSDVENLVLEVATCRCVRLGTEGDACLSSATCASSLTCQQGQCLGDAPGGAPCSAADECASNFCEEAPGPGGVCSGADGDPCGEVADCAFGAELACDGGRCAREGSAGALCREGPDCESFSCDTGLCR